MDPSDSPARAMGALSERVAKSCAAGIAWPALPTGPASRLLAVVHQLNLSQWWPGPVLASCQARQLLPLLDHAIRTVPHYREHFRAAGLPADAARLLSRWDEIPILTRTQVQEKGARLNSTALPNSHGTPGTIHTSGSTGRPVRVLSTNVTKLFWMAFTLREHLWHGRAFDARLAAIRPDRGDVALPGREFPTWGPPVDLLFESGPSGLLNSSTPIEHQIRWLVRQNPGYLLSLPSNIEALAEHCQANGIRLPALRGVRTYGEVLEARVRHACRAAWNARLTDTYSAQEVGYIALQCPDAEDFYHLQSEGLRVEILDEEGIPCPPGRIGRVVLSTLHNLASPLIRYEIGDYAEVGEPCPCGRGLPTIRRVLGRARNLGMRPDGGRFWPSFPAPAWAEIAPIGQIQLVQETRRRIQVRYVMALELSSRERDALADSLHRCLGYPFELIFVRREAGTLRGRNGKYEDFVCTINDEES
jgi:phenylacetate-CoA ligase